MKKPYIALFVGAGILSASLVVTSTMAEWDPTALEQTVQNHETRITHLEQTANVPSPSPTDNLTTTQASEPNLTPTQPSIASTPPVVQTPVMTPTPAATPTPAPTCSGQWVVDLSTGQWVCDGPPTHP